jgi:hypothetical protein
MVKFFKEIKSNNFEAHRVDFINLDCDYQYFFFYKIFIIFKNFIIINYIVWVTKVIVRKIIFYINLQKRIVL